MSLKYYKEEVDGDRTERSEMRKEMYRLNQNLVRTLLQVLELKQEIFIPQNENLYMKLMIIYLCYIISSYRILVHK